MVIDEWIRDVISGTKDPQKRRLGKLLEKAREGDTIVACEVSRLGRSLYMVMDILKGLLEKGVAVLTIKDGYSLDHSLQSKVLAFAFGLAAEIERDMISKRTKAALARKREKGVIFGRPFGTYRGKLLKYDTEIRKYAEMGIPGADIARLLDVQSDLVYIYCEEYNITLTSQALNSGNRGKGKKSKILDENRDNIKRDVESLMTKEAVAQKYGVSVAVLNFWLRKPPNHYVRDAMIEANNNARAVNNADCGKRITQ
jgi:DNA invertase Pin-like site-specific DNA recombinase